MSLAKFKINSGIIILARTNSRYLVNDKFIIVKINGIPFPCAKITANCELKAHDIALNEAYPVYAVN